MSNMSLTKKLPWFRLYAEAVDDEKLRLLAFEDRWHFIAILCCKCAGILDDAPQLVRRKVSVKLGVDLPTLDEIARRLAEVDLIDRKTLQPLAWERRQFKSDHDHTAADRQRRHRENKAASNGDVTRDTTVTSRTSHGRVTTPDTDTDTDTDTEADSETEKAVTPKDKPLRGRKEVARPDEVPESVWNDYLAVRKAKRASMTETALKGLRKSAALAGMTLTEALELCCERGWIGFRPDWLNSSQSNGKKSIQEHNAGVFAQFLGFGQGEVIDA